MPAFGYRENTELPRYLRFLKNRKIAVLVGATFVAGILIMFSNKGLLRRIMLAHELDASRERIELLRSDIRSLRASRDLLAADRFTIERTAREAHGMIKPGEVVYRIRAAVPENSPTRPTRESADR
jgi:cell division protein FtsB